MSYPKFVVNYSMQAAYQSPYSAGSAAAAAAAASAFAAGYYPQNSAYGVISQSYSGECFHSFTYFTSKSNNCKIYVFF